MNTRSEDRLLSSPVVGADVMELGLVPTSGGRVMHALRGDYALTPHRLEDGRLAVGEIYFSEVEPGQVRAWKRHSRQTQHFCVPSGRLGLVLFDDRPDSLSRGSLARFLLGPDDLYALVRIPHGVWYGFASLGKGSALVCNVTDIPHDPAEGERLDPASPEAARFPFDWNKVSLSSFNEGGAR